MGMRKFFNLIYKLHLKRPYRSVDRLRYLKRLDRKKHPHDSRYYSEKDASQHKKGEILISSGFRDTTVMFLCDPSFHVERNIIRDGLYGPHILNFMAAFLTPGCAVLDIGANIGAYSVPLAKAFPDVEVHAFEPGSLAVIRLKRNLLLNGLKNVRIHEVGVGSASETLEFHSYGLEDLGLSSFVRPGRKGGLHEALPVEVVTLDEVCTGLERDVTVIKIDVQGYEFHVLEGARALIRKKKPYIVMEHEDDNFIDPDAALKAKSGLKNFFTENSYAVFYMTRYDPDMMFPVSWESPLCGDLIAMPLAL
jgi:FkbM family methyltransferase